MCPNLTPGTTIKISGNDIYVYADNPTTAELDADEIVTYYEACEEQLSRSLRANRQFLKEHWAKKHAGYNAAWKYHCTYGNGSETEPTYERHPAFAAHN